MLCVFCPPFKVYTSELVCMHQQKRRFGQARRFGQTNLLPIQYPTLLPFAFLHSNCLSNTYSTHNPSGSQTWADPFAGFSVKQTLLKCCEIDINPSISVEFVEAPLPQSRFRHDTSRPNPWAKSDRWSIGQSFIMQEIFFVEISMGDRQNIVERVIFKTLICW